MKKALIALAICSVSQPALAQWGLYGFAADGLVYQIDEFTGDIALVGDIGVPVVDAAGSVPQTIIVLTDDDRILSVNLRNLETTVLAHLAGRPSGYVPVAYGGYAVVLRPPVGDDILFTINWSGLAYREIGPTGLNDVTGMTYSRVCTASGGAYDFSFVTGQTSLVWRVTNGDRLEAIARVECGDIATGEGMYMFKPGMRQPVQIRSTGFAHINALAYSSAIAYACDLTGIGPGVCDIFDFLEFQSLFVNGDPLACDCDTSTGPGVCDIFDFLCFQNAWAEAMSVVSGCR